MITPRTINREIQDSQGSIYVAGASVGMDYNPRIIRARTKAGQLQGYTTQGWIALPQDVIFIDGSTGRQVAF